MENAICACGTKEIVIFHIVILPYAHRAILTQRREKSDKTFEFIEYFLSFRVSFTFPRRC